MIFIKTPLRVSLVGGSTDIKAFYKAHPPGGVVSFTINKFVYIAVNKKFEDDIRISYSLTENVDSVDVIKHDLVRECLIRLGITGGIEINSIADIPGQGSGLGSSSAFTVGLLNALSQYKIMHGGEDAEGISDVAETACEIEIEKCGKPIGKQDQYACAYGGLNHFSFQEDGEVIIKRIELDPSFKYELESHMLLFWTGRSRRSSSVLREQGENIQKSGTVVERMKEMVALASRMHMDLSTKKLDSIGSYLNQNWELKRGLASKITDAQIDNWYSDGMNAGAEGAKICGAGGGGFMLFWAKKRFHSAIIKAVGLRHIPFKIEKKGTRIAYMKGLT